MLKERNKMYGHNAYGQIKYHFVICVFYCLWSFLAIILIFGCNRNIPPASKAVRSKVTLSWNEIPGALSYNVYGSTSPGVTKLRGHKISNVSNPFTFDKLRPGKTYYFVFAVITEQGESEESKEFSYTAVMDKVGVIDLKDLFDKPIKYQESSTSEKGNVTLAWDNVPNATSYNIYWKDSPGVTKFNGKKISNVNNPHTIKGLKPGTFYFVVTAVNELGESAESEEFSISVD